MSSEQPQSNELHPTPKDSYGDSHANYIDQKRLDPKGLRPN